MKNLINYSHKLLFDGEESSMYKFLKENSISVANLKGLLKIKTEISSVVFEEILKIIGAESFPAFNSFQKDGCELEYILEQKESKNMITVYGIKEIQPGRFQCYIECEFSV